MVDNPYVIMNRDETLGVIEYPDEGSLKKYLMLFPKPIYYAKVENESDVWLIRTNIKKELDRDVRNIIRKLWGHIGKKA
jgi:hypothetical protein